MQFRQNGFTLIEMVIAVAIFAVIASIVFPGLLQFLEMRERIEEKHKELISLQKTFLFMGNDLRYAANRLSKDEYGELGKTTLSLNDDSIMEFVALYPDIHLDGLSVPRRLRWEIEDQQLRRVQYPVMDPDSDTRVIAQNLLSGVEDYEIEVSFVEDGRDNTDDKWEEQSRLPDLVKFSIQMVDGTEYHRSFTMMGGDNEAAIAAATIGAQQGTDNQSNGGSDQDQLEESEQAQPGSSNDVPER